MVKTFTNLYEAVFTAPPKEEKDKNFKEWIKIKLIKIIKKDKLIPRLDGMYDYNGELHLSNLDLKSLLYLPYQLHTIHGNFWCSDNELISLEGSPKVIEGVFDVFNNRLTSLEGGPKEVTGDYYCNHNQLISLKGSPERVKIFDCSYNQLKSLDKCPRYVDGIFTAVHNNKNFTKKEVLKNCVMKLIGDIYIYV